MPGRRGAAPGKTSGWGRFRRGPVSFVLSQPEFAMPIVAVYKFRANLHDTETQKYALPRDGLSREGLLLLRQERDARDDAAAIAACATFGALDAVIERYSLLDPTVLGNPQNKDFVPLHATALSEGRSMMYYINSAPADEAPLVTQAGFRPA